MGGALMGGVLVLVVFAIARHLLTKPKHCVQCGTEGKPVTSDVMQVLAFVLALGFGVAALFGGLVWLVLALAFLVATVALGRPRCASCGHKTLVPVDSPVAVANRARFTAAKSAAGGAPASVG